MSPSRGGHAVGLPVTSSHGRGHCTVRTCCCSFLLLFCRCLPSLFLLLSSPPLNKAINPIQGPGPTRSHLTVCTSCGAPFQTPTAYVWLESLCFPNNQLWGESSTARALTCQSVPQLSRLMKDPRKEQPRQFYVELQVNQKARVNITAKNWQWAIQ